MNVYFVASQLLSGGAKLTSSIAELKDVWVWKFDPAARRRAIGRAILLGGHGFIYLCFEVLRRKVAVLSKVSKPVNFARHVTLERPYSLRYSRHVRRISNAVSCAIGCRLYSFGWFVITHQPQKNQQFPRALHGLVCNRTLIRGNKRFNGLLRAVVPWAHTLPRDCGQERQLETRSFVRLGV